MMRLGVSISIDSRAVAGDGGVAGAISSIVALGPVKFHYAGATYVTIDAANAESGDQVSQWNDLSGNANHSTQATQDDQPSLVTDADATWLDFDKDDGTTGDSMTTPRPLSGLAAATVITAYKRTTLAVAQTLWAFDNADFRLNITSGNAFQGIIGGASNTGSFTEATTTPHVLQLIFDGAGATNADRLKIKLDQAEKVLTFAGTIPAALPALAAGQLARNTTLQPLDGRLALHAEFNKVLSGAEEAAFYAAASVLLPFLDSVVFPGTDLTEAETVLAISGTAVDESATGTTLTLGTTVLVTDNGGPEVGFTGMCKEAGGTIRLCYRKATTHGVDPTGKIVYKDSTDSGATWGSEVTLVDTPGIDDRDASCLYLDGSSNMRCAWFLHSGTARQAYDTAVAGGAIVNISGFPLSPSANVHTARPVAYDAGVRFALYGAPLDGSQLYRVGLVHRAGGTLKWLKTLTVNLYEPAIVRVDVNTLLIVVRVASQADPTDHQQMMLTRSTDNGVTWSDWKKFSEIGDAPTLFLHSSGKVFLAYRRRVGGVTFSTGIMWTADAGLTWGAASDVYVHTTQDSSYPAIVELADGRLLVSHYEPRFIRVTPVTIT